MTVIEKSITVAYLDELDQIAVRTFRGRCGYDILGNSLIKVWEGSETLVLPVTRLISLAANLQ